MFTAASQKPKQHRLSISFPESFIAFNFIPSASLVKIAPRDRFFWDFSSQHFSILCWMICKCQDVRDVGKVRELRTSEPCDPAGDLGPPGHCMSQTSANQNQGLWRLTNQKAGLGSQNMSRPGHVLTGVGSKSNYLDRKA